MKPCNDNVAFGAAAGLGSSSVCEALGGIVDMLQRTMGDSRLAGVLKGSGPQGVDSAGRRSHGPAAVAASDERKSSDAEWPSSTPATTVGALEALRRLSLAAAAGTSSSSPPTAQQPPAAPAAPFPPPIPPDGRPLRLQRTATWADDSSARIHGLLQRCLPPLCRHPRSSVRRALALAAMQLMAACGRSMRPSSGLLLEVVLTLAQDEWQQVGEPCVAERLCICVFNFRANACVNTDVWKEHIEISCFGVLPCVFC